jgi:hypothetical protein
VHDFALGLDEFHQLVVSHVVKVAGLVDLFLGEQVHFAAQQFQSPVGGFGVHLRLERVDGNISDSCFNDHNQISRIKFDVDTLHAAADQYRTKGHQSFVYDQWYLTNT